MATLTMTPTYGGSMPRFPLSQPPRCNKCDNFCNREPRGKRFCYCCPCTGPQNKTWGTWDDAQGVQPGNPVCDCGFYCRVRSVNARCQHTRANHLGGHRDAHLGPESLRQDRIKLRQSQYQQRLPTVTRKFRLKSLYNGRASLCRRTLRRAPDRRRELIMNL